MSSPVKFPYRILVEWSDSDAVFIARVPSLPQVSAHGDTAEEAIKEVQIAASLFLDDPKFKAPPSDLGERFSGKLNLRIPESLHADLSRRATIEGVSLNQLMVYLLSRPEPVLATVATTQSKGRARKAVDG